MIELSEEGEIIPGRKAKNPSLVRRLLGQSAHGYWKREGYYDQASDDLTESGREILAARLKNGQTKGYSTIQELIAGLIHAVTTGGRHRIWDKDIDFNEEIAVEVPEKDSE